MTAFLVLAELSFSSRPLRLCQTRQEALDFIKGIRWADAHPGPKTKRGELGPPGLRDRLQWVGIVEFDQDGLPGKCEPVALAATAEEIAAKEGKGDATP